MQSITLLFSQRVILWNLIGNYNAPNLREASVYLRIIEKIRISDIEQAEVEFRTVDQQYTWRLPSTTYGTATVDLEMDEAKALATALESATPVRVADAAWMCDLVAQLHHPLLELVTNSTTN